MTDDPTAQQAQELYHRYRVATRLVEKFLREARPLIAERGARFNADDLTWRLEDTTKRVERLGFTMPSVLAGLDPFGVYTGVSSTEIPGSV